MILNKGQKVHIITRRGFEGDIRRHFVGRVLEVNDVSVLLEGYVFVFVGGTNEYIKKEDKRTRIFSIIDVGNIINVLPDDALLDKILYRNDDKRLVVTDDQTFKLDIHEFGSHR